MFFLRYSEEVTIGKVVCDFRAALSEADIHVYNDNLTGCTAQIVEVKGSIVRTEPR